MVLRWLVVKDILKEISNKFVRHPSDVLKVGDIVTVWVLSVDVDRNRIGLTMKKPPENSAGKS